MFPNSRSRQTPRNDRPRTPKPRPKHPVVYVLTCRDGSLYTGWTIDLPGRLAAHRRGDGSRYVRSRLPFTLRAWWKVKDRSAALRDEARFKALSRARKLAALEAGQVFGRRVRNAPA